MTSFYQVDESGGTSAVTLGEASEGSAIQDQYHEDVLTSNLDFDTVVDAGIYRYESIGDSSQHVPSDASSGYVFVFVESDKHSMRSIVQIAFDDNGGVLVRRGAISDTNTTIGAWEDLNASGSSTFAISSASPAGTVGGSWSVVSGYEDVGIWKQVNIIMTLADAVNTTILLDVATFALSGTQTIYVSNGDGTFSPIILDIINGGTGANSAAGARTALGAASQADLDSLRDSVSQVQVISVGPAKVYKQCNIVICRLYAAKITLSGSWDTYLLGPLPEDFKPRESVGPNVYQIRQPVEIDEQDTTYSTALWINGNGDLYVANFGGTGFNGTAQMSCTACWTTPEP